ncbi:uncharacterized protein K452DRAFT_353274 [Aplosporella prunicola CBS 121167]|uniref:NACHT-NTPase and P-loop NTPases N-terminal domain-containing protein n=1 Tax=Aplosporella prunicola CBS 121167 TaxID=1176127 RepID=A0A6A6B5I9_9PEZI|nr:uncharacterized protein K452DRAFT_353274 [Aplosporella prunicola CBS 121167]KAF2138031.1 hypothetical protein K452DRAFT_353274 [Aplosporella prunicola CBS 121167]
MEALAAIGLAGNIAQFLDFGFRILSQSRELYRSGSGSLQENIDLENVTTDLERLVEGLAVKPSQQCASQDDIRLSKLAASCQSTSNDLVMLLGDLKMGENPPRKRWYSFRYAIRTWRKKSRLQELQQRLEMFRNQVNVHLLSDIKTAVNSIEDLSLSSLNYVKILLQGMQQPNTVTDLNYSQKIMESLHIIEKFLEMREQDVVKSKNKTVLGSLRFESFHLRDSQVKEAHK